MKPEYKKGDKDMNKFFLLSLAIGFAPLCANAQDDMYFMPKKDKTAAKADAYYNQRRVYHSGSYRDVDEYNRRGFSSSYTFIGDTLASDAIDFYGNTPDSLYVAKQKGKYSKGKYYGYVADDDCDYYWRARRFDDDFFWAYDPWFYDDPWYRSYYGYYGPYYSFGWGRPWRYGYYGGWYDPWYYSYGGWYDPWYYGWNRPYWGTTVAYRPANRGGITGSSNHGWVGRPGITGDRRNGFSNGSRNNVNPSLYRGSNSTSSRNTDAYNRQTTRRNTDFSNYRRDNDNFSRSRNNETFRRSNDSFSQSNHRNNASFGSGSFNRGGSFGGGNHGGGGYSGGGGRSGGGGHFGGRR